MINIFKVHVLAIENAGILEITIDMNGQKLKIDFISNWHIEHLSFKTVSVHFGIEHICHSINNNKHVIMASNVRGILSLRNDIQTKSEFQKKSN